MAIAGLPVCSLARIGTGELHLIVDSTGLKLRGAGEWLFEKHGTTKRRAWRKLHIGIVKGFYRTSAIVLRKPGWVLLRKLYGLLALRRPARLTQLVHYFAWPIKRLACGGAIVEVDAAAEKATSCLAELIGRMLCIRRGSLFRIQSMSLALV